MTLDLAETDDRHRDELRVRLNEPFRTVIGHLRHEIGHHYWSVLVRDRGCETSFRQLFGDERVDYRTAVEAYYTGNRPAWDPTIHTTAYRRPIRSRTGRRRSPTTSTSSTGSTPRSPTDWHRPISQWTRTSPRSSMHGDRSNTSITAVAAAVGMPPIYPFDPTGVVVDKLAFVHDRVTHPFVTTRKETHGPQEATRIPFGTTESPRSRN